MTDSSVVDLASVRPMVADASEWSPREMLCSLIGTAMPHGCLIGWVDEQGHVQFRRAKLSPGTELDILKTGKKLLFDQS